MARQSVVMLKNYKQLLPLDKKTLKRIALIGRSQTRTWDQLGVGADGDGDDSVSLLKAVERNGRQRRGDRLFQGDGQRPRP